MHLLIALIVIFWVWRWTDWKNIQKYQASMLFITASGLLYEYLTRNFSLWIFQKDYIINHEITVVIYAILTMPLSVFLFLSRYPTGSKIIQLKYILMWVALYAVTELVLQFSGRIIYENGWTYWYSVLFDIMMFPMLRLHHIKPLRAYAISLLIIIALMWYFKVPFEGGS